jgi:hypothetical protein
MKKKNTIEDEIDAIRLKIHDETKDMTLQERRERLNNIVEPIAEKYGFKIIASAKDQ